MRVVYVSGPDRGCPIQDVFSNTLPADVWRFGGVAIDGYWAASAADNSSTDEEVLAGCLEILRRCDGLLTVHGWADDNLRRAEVEVARENGVQVFEDLEELRRWLAVPR